MVMIIVGIIMVFIVIIIRFSINGKGLKWFNKSN